MRIHRIGLFVAWAIVAVLAVAGFAAFSASDDVDGPGGAEAVTIAAVAPDLGRSAGVVAGLSFVYFVNGEEATTTTVDVDEAVERAIDRRIAEETTTTSTEPEDDTARGSVYIRSRFLSETEVRELIAEYFEPGDVNRAVRIAWCESSFNPTAVNPITGAAGLFQHLPGQWPDLAAQAGWAGADPLDPEANVAVAAWLLYEVPGGWSHWQCQA